MSLRAKYNTFEDLPTSDVQSGTEAKETETNENDISTISTSSLSAKIRLKREIGLLEGTSITIGAVIGSGIFISPKGIVEAVGSVGLSLIIWVASGILAIVGGVCYAELGTSFPSSGGDYHYLFEAFGPLPAFLFIWTAMIIFVPCNNAILALSFGQYVMQPLFSHECSTTMPDSALRLTAGLAICILTAMNCYGVGGSAKVQNVFSFVKIATLVLIIITGIVKLFQGNYGNFQNAFENSNTDPGSIALGFFSGIYAYGGANTLNAMAEEVKDPNRTLPRSIYISMTTVIVVYLLTNAAYFTVMSPDEMLRSQAVAVTFGDKTLGVIAWVISICVALSTFGGLAVNIMQSSRILFAGARNGHFPLMLSHILHERRTPTPSLIFLCILSLLYLTTSNVLQLINYAGFIFSLVAFGAGLAIVYMRRTKPDHLRPVKVNIIYPYLYLAVSLFLFFLPIYTAPVEAAIGCAITVSGLPIYYFVVKLEEKPAWLVNFLERSTILVQKLFISLPTDDDED